MRSDFISLILVSLATRQVLILDGATACSGYCRASSWQPHTAEAGR